jgi:hypothetical protein
MNKTKTFFLILIGLILSNLMYAQKSNIDFGIKTGVNQAKYTGTLIAAEYNFKTGFYIGGFANFSVTERFKIQPELLFALQGSNFTIKNIEIREYPSEPPIIGDYKTKISETTISIPIIAQYLISEKFFIELGPQIGLILDRKEEVTKSPTDDPTFNTINDFDPDFFDLGLTTGVGYSFNEKFSLNFRYFFGLIERDLFKVKSSVINLGLEYKLSK